MSPAQVRRWFRRHVVMEVVALAIGLVTLSLGSGAIGWAIGHATSGGTRTPRVAAPATGRRTTSPATATSPQSATDTAAGRAIFASTGCAGCHTLHAAGATGTVGPDLDTISLGADEIAAVVAYGKGVMPAFSGQLSERQISDVAAFVAQAAGSH